MKHPDQGRGAETRPGRRAKTAAATRTALISAARHLFSTLGYHATGTHDVVALAGVTRGALYHHFPDKQSLFLAVFDTVERDLMAATTDSDTAFQGEDPWQAFCASAQLFLTAAATRQDVHRILLVDGPSVLGWVKWRTLELEYGLGVIMAALEAAMMRGQIKEQPVRPLAHLVLASLHEAALMIAHSPNRQETRVEVGAVLAAVLRGLERQTAPSSKAQPTS